MKHHFTRSIFLALACAAMAMAGMAQAATSTFDDLPLGPESHYAPGVVGNGSGNFPFTSGEASFNHRFDDYGFAGCCSSGWTYSNQTDNSTAGFGNQYSAYAGGGQGGSANYGVAYLGQAQAQFASATVVGGAWFTNTTYAALSMRDGDSFAKQFGGDSGNDADYLKLTITGFNGSANTGAVDFYLADYRFADNTQDYIVSQWSFVDLASLGAVTRMEFTLSSSDNGDYGMNTPAYFAMDTLAPVPEPHQSLMLLAGLLAMGGAVRRQRSRRG